jgi:outer membrane immunogenic protein
MRRALLSLLASTALLGMAGAASAADIAAAPAYKAPAPAAYAAPFSWTGFYVGGHLGWGFTDFNTGVGSADLDGFLGGLQTGFNYQIGQWVLGIEGDISWTDISESGSDGLGNGYSASLDWLASITGRVGVAFDNALLYAKGGIAFADTSASVTLIAPFGPIPAGTYTVDDTSTGWTLGAGLEYAFWDNWSAKIEYQYYSFETDDFAVGLDSDNADLHTVKFGVNYRFGAPAPVAARY